MSVGCAGDGSTTVIGWAPAAGINSTRLEVRSVGDVLLLRLLA